MAMANKSLSQDRARLTRLIDAYGADPARWPAGDSALAKSQAAHDMDARIAAERVFENVLEQGRAQTPATGLADLIVAQATAAAVGDQARNRADPPAQARQAWSDAAAVKPHRRARSGVNVRLGDNAGERSDASAGRSSNATDLPAGVIAAAQSPRAQFAAMVLSGLLTVFVGAGLAFQIPANTVDMTQASLSLDGDEAGLGSGSLTLLDDADDWVLGGAL